MMVLDRQQRLQGLFIGLKGSYSCTSSGLYLDILSGVLADPEDVRHRFAFLDKSEATWPWIRLKDIIFTSKLETQIASHIKSRAPEVVSSQEIEINELNIVRARQEFVNNDNITYQELDGIDNPYACKPNDIAEIFIRANSGGTKLNKSDLLFSLLSMHTYDLHHPILAVTQKSCSLVFLCHLERKQRDHFLSLTPPPRE